MKYLLILLVFIVTSFNTAHSQNKKIEYFKLEKVYEYGNYKEVKAGGQFVCITSNSCYDTDKFGNDVGNGKLYRDVDNKTQNLIFIGNCYYGSAKYIFTPDLSTLTIEINPHFKYIYKKVMPPNGIETSSLIKKSSNNSSGSLPQGNDLNKSITVDNYQSSGSNSNNSSSEKTPVENYNKTPRKCSFCKGTGKIEKNDNASPSFGITKSQRKCNECGKWYEPEIVVHYHLSCRNCHGSGWL